MAALSGRLSGTDFSGCTASLYGIIFHNSLFYFFILPMPSLTGYSSISSI